MKVTSHKTQWELANESKINALENKYTLKMNTLSLCSKVYWRNDFTDISRKTC